MFKFKPFSQAIEVDEPDLMTLFRSITAINVEIPGETARPLEAYACAIRANGGTEIYVALADPASKDVYIYIPDESDKKKGVEVDLLNDAVRYAESMGFRMDNVNLNYSRALREVIVKSMKIFRPHDTRKSQHGKILFLKNSEGQIAEKKPNLLNLNGDRESFSTVQGLMPL